MPRDPSAYARAQHAVAELKAAMLELLKQAGEEGLRNSDLGHALGINMGHSGEGRQEGHIPRTLLNAMEREGVVEQDTATKRWRMKALPGVDHPGQDQAACNA